MDGEKITLADFVEIWMKEYAEKELAPATLNPYKFRLEKRILLALGHLKLARIQPHHLMSFYNNLAEDGIRMDSLYVPNELFWSRLEKTSDKELGEKTGVYRKTFLRMRNGKGIYYETVLKLSNYLDANISELFVATKKDEKLSNKTIHHHHSLISSILSTAVSWNIMQTNPAERVKLPKVTKVKSTKSKYYDDHQVVDMFAALEGEPIKYKAILYLTVDTGLRLSEVAGIKWTSLDVNAQTLNIEQQRQYVSGYGVIEKDTKSESGIRQVTISDMATQILKEYRLHQMEMRIRCGTAWYESEFVFTHDDGKPIFPNTPSMWFSNFIRRKGLPKITFHGLRHTNASLLIAEGIDIVTLSGRLGHADKNVTLNTYSHIIKSQEKQAASKMDRFYERMNMVNGKHDSV